MAKPILFFITLFTFCYSCKKSRIDESSLGIISAYGDELEFVPEGKEALQIRLSFTKTVALALGDIEFRRFFKENYGKAENGHFPELYFGLNTNLSVDASGTTLYDFLKSHIDDEVEELYGADFLDIVLEKDPNVVLKFPDALINLDWDVEEHIPMAMMSAYQVPLDDFHRFIAYYHTGEHTTCRKRNDYLHIAVKYSDDYMLLDPQTFKTEKGISFYEYLPQAEYCNNGLHDEVLAIGKAHNFYTDRFVIPILESFYLWQNTCGYTGKLWQDSICPQACVLDCIPLDERVLVLDSLRMNQSIMFQVLGEEYLEEAYTYSFLCYGFFDYNFLNRITVPALPHAYFNSMSSSVVFKDNGTPFPSIYIQISDSENYKDFPIQAEIESKLLPNKTIIFNPVILVYSDAIQTTILDYDVQMIVNASNSLDVGNGETSTCYIANWNQTGSMDFRISY